MIYMLDRGDDASQMLQGWIKAERGVLNRDIVRILANTDLTNSLDGIIFEDTVIDLYVPTLWEATEVESPYWNSQVKTLKAKFLEQGIDVRFYFPFAKLQLIDVVKDKPDHKLNNGDCAHREIEEEQCGICLDCIEKFLCYKLCDLPVDEDMFLEDPFNGHGSTQRLYSIMAKLTGNHFRKEDKPLKQEISIGALLVECFFAGHLPVEVSRMLEKHYQVLLTETA